MALGIAVAGLAASFAVGIKGALDLDNAINTATAKFGLAAEEAQALGAVGRDVFENNWYESIQQATVAAGQLRAVVGDIGSAGLSELTQQAAALEQVFEIPIEDTGRLLQGMERFGIEGQRSLDLLAVSIQRTGDPADDLLDTFYEYGGQFEQLGFSAEDMAQTLVSGLEAGAFSADKVGDTVKEFGIRLREGTDATREGLALLDADLATLPDQFLAGEISGKEAFARVQQAMQDFEGEIPGQVLADVFGGPGEDLTAGVIAQLSIVGSELEGIEGSALAAGDAINSNIGSAVSGLKRVASGVFIDLFGPFLSEIKGPVIDSLNRLRGLVEGFRETNSFEFLRLSASALAKILGVTVDVVLKLVEGLATITTVVAGLPFEALSAGALGLGRALGLLPEKGDEAADALAGTGDAAAEAGSKAEEGAARVEKSATAFERLSAQLDAGGVSASNFGADLLKAAEAGEITEDELASLSSRLAGLAEQTSGDFAKFGITLDFETLGDPEALQQAISDAMSGGFEDRQEQLRELLEGEEQFQQDRAAVVADNAARLREAEEQNAEDLAKAREKAASAETDAQRQAATESIADAESAAAERLQVTQTENAQRLADLESSFAAEQEARREAIAQATIDQTLQLVRLGEVSQEQAELIFGSLKEAFPGAEVFDPTLQATLEFEGALGKAFKGGVDEAVALGDAARNLDDSLHESAAAAEDAEAALVKNFQNARAEAEALSEVRVAPSFDDAIEAGRGYSEAQLAVDQGIIESSGLRAAATEESLARESDAGAAALALGSAVADELRSMNEGLSLSGLDRADATEEALGRENAARQGASSEALVAAGEIETGNERVRVSADETASAVEDAGGRLGGSYAGAAATFKGQTADIASAYDTAAKNITGGQRDVLAAIESTNPALSGQARSLQELEAASARAKDARVRGEEDASEAAQAGASDVDSALSGVRDSLDQTSTLVEDYAALLDEVPPLVETEFTFDGLVTGIALVTQLQKEILEAQRIAALGVPLEVTAPPVAPPAPRPPGGPGVPPDSFQPPEDLGLPPDFFVPPADSLVGEVLDGGLGRAIDALAESIDDLGQSGSSVAGLDDEMQGLLDDLERAAAAALKAKGELDAFGGTVETILGFLDAGPGQAGFAGIAALFDATRLDEAGEAFRKLIEAADLASAEQARGLLPGLDIDALIAGAGLGVKSLDELEQKLRSLSDSPEQQLELWDQVVAVFEKDLLPQLGEYRERLDKLDNDKSLPGGVSRVVTEEFKRLHGLQESLNFFIEQMGSATDRQAETLKRLSDAYKEAEAEAARALKAAQDYIKERQKQVIDAEKAIHKERMRLLDKEIERQTDRFEDELDFLDERKKALEEQRDLAEEAHEERLAQLDEERDAVLARLDPLDDDIEEIERRIRAMKLAELEGIEGSAEAAVESVTALQILLTKIQKETLERGRFDISRRIALTTAEQAELEDAIASGQIDELIRTGILDERAGRLAKIAAAGGRLRPDQLLAILEAIGEKEDEAGSAAETALEQEERRLEILRLRRQVQEDALQEELDGIEERRRREELSFERESDYWDDRIAAVDAARERVRESYDDYKAAIDRMKDAEAERHEARVDQINREHALELLRLGKTEAEVRDILAEQEAQAERIAAEARERFRQQMADLQAERERLREEREELRRRARDIFVPLPAPVPPTDPGLPIPPPQPPGSTTFGGFGGFGAFSTDTTDSGGAPPPGELLTMLDDLGRAAAGLDFAPAEAGIERVHSRMQDVAELAREIEDTFLADLAGGRTQIEVRDNRVLIEAVNVSPDDPISTLLDPRRRR